MPLCHPEHVCCVGSPDFLGVSQDSISYAEVLKLPLVLAGQGDNLRGIVKEDKQFKELTRACKLEINSLPVLIAVIRDAFGCAFLAARTVKEYVERGELNARLITDPIISRELHIVYLRDSVHTPLLNKLAGIIKAQIIQAFDPNDETIEPIYD